MYTIRGKLAYSIIGKIISRYLRSDNARANWLRQAFTEGNWELCKKLMR